MDGAEKIHMSSTLFEGEGSDFQIKKMQPRYISFLNFKKVENEVLLTDFTILSTEATWACTGVSVNTI